MNSMRVLSLVCSAIFVFPVTAQTLASVNGKEVPMARVEIVMEQVKAQAASQKRQLSSDVERRVRDKVVLDEMLAQESERRGLATTPNFTHRLELARQELLGQLLQTQHAGANPVSDKQIQEEYDRLKAGPRDFEYRVRHILVEHEQEAADLLAQVRAGAKFEVVAKKHSKDAESAANGGGLDFAGPEDYLPEFSGEMVKLKVGEMSAKPVKTRVGWHLIKLEEKREAKFPEFDEVKEPLRVELERRKYREFVAGIRAKSATNYKFRN